MDFLRPVESVIPGAQGRILSVLVETTAPLNLRTLARLAQVSPAQASRVLPRLVELGVVERFEVPPSSQFTLARSNVAAVAIVALARSHEAALEHIRLATSSMTIAPASVMLFGSFARGSAVAGSDIDAVVVRPAGIDEEDDEWLLSLESWRASVAAITGNPVEIVEVGRDEARSKLAGRSEFWRNLRRDGVCVYGLDLDQLAEMVHA